MTPTKQTRAGGAIPSGSDDGTIAAAEDPQKSKRNEKPNCHTAFHAGQALRVIEGEAKAAQYLARLQSQQADPDELALIVATLYGATLRGFCCLIGKALGVRHE